MSAMVYISYKLHSLFYVLNFTVLQKHTLKKRLFLKAEIEAYNVRKLDICEIIEQITERIPLKEGEGAIGEDVIINVG